jgi:hypothetical protein
MSISTEGEQLRRAIKWIGDKRLDDPGAILFKLIEEASIEFDLPPKDEDFLMRHFAGQGQEGKS